jgi:hypothetical protein
LVTADRISFNRRACHYDFPFLRILLSCSGLTYWEDKSGRRLKCLCVEGCRFRCAGLCYLDEFTQPVKNLKQRADHITQISIYRRWPEKMEGIETSGIWSPE